MHRRVVIPAFMEPLPLHTETIGHNPDQETVDRPQGYPHFHWLHCLEGEGELEAAGFVWKLPPCSGVLLHPHIPHRYRARTAVWQTAYVTFEANFVADWLNSSFTTRAERIQWDADKDRITRQWEHMLEMAEAGTDRSGWEGSAHLYRFLTLLKTDGRTDHRPSMSRRLEKMQHLLDWLEQEYANPELGLSDFAGKLGIGERQLNERFRQLFGQTAYAYLIQLRLRKAKEKLPVRPDLTVRDIGESVGFRDASHFVAMFRQKEGMTPETYRRLHGA